MEFPRKPDVVLIEERDQVATGMAKAAISSRPAVWLAEKREGMLAGHTLDECFIAWPVTNDDCLFRGKRLGEYATDRRFDIAFAIEERNDRRNGRYVAGNPLRPGR